VVLRKDETAAGQTYKYAKVTKVHTSMDGKVRAADIEYKLPGESVFRTTTRPIHKLVLIVPIEEQVSVADQAEEEEAEPGQPAPLAEAEPGPAQPELAPLAIEPEPAHRGELEMAEKEEGPGGAVSRPAQSEKGATRPAVKYKKVISRKKAGTGTNNYCDKAKRGGRDCGCRGEAPEEGETKEGTQRGSTGSAQGECLGPWKGSVCGPCGWGRHLGEGGAGSS
jgi:hypothetical protein